MQQKKRSTPSVDVFIFWIGVFARHKYLTDDRLEVLRLARVNISTHAFVCVDLDIAPRTTKPENPNFRRFCLGRKWP